MMTAPPTIFGHRGGVEVITDGDATFTVIDWRDGGATWPHADLGQFLFGVQAWKGGWHDDLMPPLMGRLPGRQTPGLRNRPCLICMGRRTRPF